MGEKKERCEICKFFEPEDDRFGQCRNQSISRKAKYRPCASWPKVRRDFFCGLFQSRLDNK